MRVLRYWKTLTLTAFETVVVVEKQIAFERIIGSKHFVHILSYVRAQDFDYTLHLETAEALIETRNASIVKSS